MNQTAVFLGLLCAVALGHWIAEDVLPRAHGNYTAYVLRSWMRGSVLAGAIWLVIWSFMLVLGLTSS